MKGYLPLLVLAIGVGAPTGSFSAEPTDWSIGGGVGYTGFGTLRLNTYRLGDETLKGVGGPSYSLSLQRRIFSMHDWSVRGGAELGYTAARTGRLVGVLGPGAARVDRLSGFAKVGAYHELGWGTPYFGIAAGVLHDRVSITAPSYSEFQKSDTVPAAKAFVGVDWNTKPVEFGFGAAAGTAFGHRF